MSRIDNAYNIDDLRRMAKSRLPRGVFEFVERGTEDETGISGNMEALRDIKFSPYRLKDISGRTAKTTLFGKPMAMPVAVAPTGSAGLLWYDGEVALARAAAKIGIPFTLATRSTVAFEDLPAKAGGHLWFQQYMWADRNLSLELVDRVAAAGYEALLITVDTPCPSNREYNKRNGFGLPFKPNRKSLTDMALKPSWMLGVLARYLMTTGMPRFENNPIGMKASITQGVEGRPFARTDNLNWDDIKAVRARWPRTLIIKGLLRVDDAIRAAEIGADGIVVSNHGARAVDHAPATIEVLPRIADAVGHRLTVLMDSGIRRGSDVVKALSLGAAGVLVGRAALYGVAAGGEAGAIHALDLLRREIETTLGLVGCRTIDQLSRDLIHRPEVLAWAGISHAPAEPDGARMKIQS